MIKKSLSNIAWSVNDDSTVYNWMKKYGYSGLEIAPTRIIPESPYSKLNEIQNWLKDIKTKYGFVVPSMQSIWFGRNEKIFGSVEERTNLVEYTKKAIDFAEIIECKNLVFGCPRNRNVPEGINSDEIIPFFKEIGDYAAKHGTVIAMEANPPIYNTNYINNTISALELIKKVDSNGFMLNLDVGTMIENKEDIGELVDNVKYINHVHISEPGLKPIMSRQLHKELSNLLSSQGYDRFVSIEMGKIDDITTIEKTMIYIREVFSN